VSPAPHGPARGSACQQRLGQADACVFERGEAPRPTSPEPYALLGHALPLLGIRRWSLPGAWVRPRLRTGPSLAAPAEVRHSYEEDGLRVQQYFSAAETPQQCSALVTPVATEPQEVFGAATSAWSLHMEIKSAPATDGRPRSVLESGKKAKKPLTGRVCLLTRGVLIRVRLVRVRYSAPDFALPLPSPG
jgi:hypothetical protein